MKLTGEIGSIYGVRIVESQPAKTFYSESILSFMEKPMLYEVAIIVRDTNGKAYKFEVENILAGDAEEAKMKMASTSTLVKNLAPTDSIMVKVRAF